MQRLKSLRQNKFNKGYNDKLGPEELPPGFAADALNCFVDEEKVRERNGYTIIGNDVGNDDIEGLTNFEQDDGTKFLLMVAGGQIYKWTGLGNWAVAGGADTVTADLECNFEQANDNIYLFNGTDTPVKFNGTTCSTVAAIPVGRVARWFHNYMFVAGVDGNRSRLYFSNLNNPETWGGSDFIDVNVNDDEPITALYPFNDELIIFKRSRIWALTGFGTAGFAVTDLQERVTAFGCSSARGIVNIGNDLYFISYVGQTPHIRSLTRSRFGVTIAGGIVSDPITGTMDGLSTAQLSKTAAIFDGRYVYFAVPDGSSTNNDLVLVKDTIQKEDEGWVRFTGINAAVWAQSSVEGEPTIYFGESGANSQVYKMDSSMSDNGTAILFRWDSPNHQIDPEIKNKWKYLWTVGETVGNVNVEVDVSPDGFTFESQGNLNLQGTGSTFPFTFPFQLGATSIVNQRFDLAFEPKYNMQVRFTKNDTDARAIIREYSLLFYQKGLRDTVSKA